MTEAIPSMLPRNLRSSDLLPPIIHRVELQTIRGDSCSQPPVGLDNHRLGRRARLGAG